MRNSHGCATSGRINVVRPQYDRQGTFMGFSLWVGGEWTPPQPYSVLALAMRGYLSEPLSLPPKPAPKPLYGGYGCGENHLS